MINKGDLFLSIDSPGRPEGKCFVEVVRTYNKRDIDPDCPESVAIIGIVEIVVLSGSDIGKSMRFLRRGFNQRFVRVEEAS